MKPVISVVVPAYNEEKLLPKCLDALKKQSFDRPYEIIVVDNNSTDKTAKIAKKAGVKVVSEKKKGISSARQKGIDVSQAEIIAQTDADSIPDKNWLKEIFSVLDSNSSIIGVSGPSYHNSNKPMFKYKLVNLIFNLLTFRIIPFLLGNAAFRGHNVAFRKKL